MEQWQYDTFKVTWRTECGRRVRDLGLNAEGDHFTMAAVSPLADFSFDYQDLYFQPANGRRCEALEITIVNIRTESMVFIGAARD
jgi:hypothetical protein